MAVHAGTGKGPGHQNRVPQGTSGGSPSTPSFSYPVFSFFQGF